MTHIQQLFTLTCLSLLLPLFQAGSSERPHRGTGLPLDPAVEAMIDAVSPDTMFSNLGALVGFYTRHTNSDTVSNVVGIGAARRWIYAQFQRYAADPAAVDLVPSYFAFTETVCGVTGEHRNVLATLPGIETPDRNFLVTGHMDSRNEDNCDNVGYAPGANDDCSGTVVAMEMARVMSRFGFESTVILMPVTGEEQGLYGSEAYAEFALQQGMRIDGTLTNDIVANIEGCADPSCPPGEPVIIDSISVRHFSGDPEHGISRQLARYMKLQAIRYMLDFTVNLIAALDRPGRGGDHIPFYERGFAAVRFTEAYETGDGSGMNGRQHNMFDTISAINTNKGYMANIVRVSIAGFASLALAPATPTGLEAFDAGDGQSVLLTWPLSQTEPDFAGYMIAVRNTDSLYYTSFYDVGSADQFTVSGLTPDEPVYLSLAAYDSVGNLSIFSEEALITPSVLPAMPQSVEATSRSSDVFLAWDPNTELDLVTYRIYRSTKQTTGFVLHDSVAVPTTVYADMNLSSHTKYFYQIRVVDDDGNESPPSETVAGQLATHDLGILVVDGTRDGNGTVISPTDGQVDDQYLLLLNRFALGGHYDIGDSVLAIVTLSDADLAPYSTVLWHTDVRGSSAIRQDTTALRKYLQQGGRLFMCGWKLSASWKLGAVNGVNTYAAGTFVPVLLKVDSTLTSGSLSEDFMTAVSNASGFPDVDVDSTRMPLYDGTLVNTDVVLPPFADPTVEVVYTHHGAIPGSNLEGKPVGWRYTGADYAVVVFDFPLYYMEPVSAEAALRMALVQLGEPTPTDPDYPNPIPRSFRLYQNYPNPFNPSTEIRFDLPEASRATIVIFDLLGQEVRTLLNEDYPAGSHRAIWDGRGNNGLPVSSGVYFYAINASRKNRAGEGFVDVRSMVLVK